MLVEANSPGMTQDAVKGVTLTSGPNTSRRERETPGNVTSTKKASWLKEGRWGHHANVPTSVSLELE